VPIDRVEALRKILSNESDIGEIIQLESGEIVIRSTTLLSEARRMELHAKCVEAGLEVRNAELREGQR
jgi:hypothetical protein